jgi:hypothetical protein
LTSIKGKVILDQVDGKKYNSVQSALRDALNEIPFHLLIKDQNNY